MKCQLEKLDHSGFRDSFKNTYLQCALFKKDGELGTVCAGCCIRISQWLEYRQRATLGGMVTLTDLKRDPDCWVDQLPVVLLPYHEKLKRFTYETLVHECTLCKRRQPRPDEQPPMTAPPTEMNYVRREDLR